jgi:hypothetical protein
MTDPAVALVMLGILVFTICIGFPVAFTLMALGVGFGFYAYFQAGQAFFDSRVFYLLTQNTFTVLNNDALVSIPLFLLMGYLVERANILDNLFRSLQVALKGIPGSLAVATLATCALFATATGIVGAVVTLMGMLAFPQMIKAGYDTRLAAGVICAGGCLGILIPPSIMLIVYGAMAGLSVVKLYAAAFVPGFFLAGMYIVYVIVLATLKPERAPRLPKDQGNFPVGEVIMMLAKSFLPLSLLILSVLGAIMFGIATPTEAAAVGALGAAHLGDGVLAVRRLGDVRIDLRLPRRQPDHQGIRARHEPERGDVPAAVAGHHLRARLAAGVDRDHHHLHPDLPADAAALRHRPHPVRRACRAQPADRIPVATDGHVGVLLEGCQPAVGLAHADLQWLHAVRLRGGPDHGDHLRLPRHRNVVAQCTLRSVMHGCEPA